MFIISFLLQTIQEQLTYLWVYLNTELSKKFVWVFP